MPHSLKNMRGFAGADVDGLDDEMLTKLGIKFYQRAAATKELEWLNLQNCPQTHSLAASDREPYLEHFVPDVWKIELRVVSDSVLSFNKYTEGLSATAAKKHNNRLF